MFGNVGYQFNAGLQPAATSHVSLNYYDKPPVPQSQPTYTDLAKQRRAAKAVLKDVKAQMKAAKKKPVAALPVYDGSTSSYSSDGDGLEVVSVPNIPAEVVAMGPTNGPLNAFASQRVFNSGGNASMAIGSQGNPWLQGNSLPQATMGPAAPGVPYNPLAFEIGRGSQLYANKGLPGNGMPQEWNGGLSQAPGDFAGTYMDPNTGVVYATYTDSMPEPLVMADEPTIQLGQPSRMLEFLTGVPSIPVPIPQEHFTDWESVAEGLKLPESIYNQQVIERQKQQAATDVFFVNNETVVGYNDTHWDGFIGDTFVLRPVIDTQTLADNSQTNTVTADYFTTPNVWQQFSLGDGIGAHIGGAMQPSVSVLAQEKPTAPGRPKYDLGDVGAGVQGFVSVPDRLSRGPEFVTDRVDAAMHEYDLAASLPQTGERAVDHTLLVTAPVAKNVFWENPQGTMPQAGERVVADGRVQVRPVATTAHAYDTFGQGHVMHSVTDSFTDSTAVFTGVPTASYVDMGRSSAATTSDSFTDRSAVHVAPQTPASVDVGYLAETGVADSFTDRSAVYKGTPTASYMDVGRSSAATTGDSFTDRTTVHTAPQTQSFMDVGYLAETGVAESQPRGMWVVSPAQPTVQVTSNFQAGTSRVATSDSGRTRLEATQALATVYTPDVQDGRAGAMPATSDGRNTRVDHMFQTSTFNPGGNVVAWYNPTAVSGSDRGQDVAVVAHQNGGLDSVGVDVPARLPSASEQDRGRDSATTARLATLNADHTLGTAFPSVSDNVRGAFDNVLRPLAVAASYENSYGAMPSTSDSAWAGKVGSIAGEGVRVSNDMTFAWTGQSLGSNRYGVFSDSGYRNDVSDFGEKWVNRDHNYYSSLAESHPSTFGKGAEFRHVYATPNDRPGLVIGNLETVRMTLDPQRRNKDVADAQRLLRTHVANTTHRSAVMATTDTAYESDMCVSDMD